MADEERQRQGDHEEPEEVTPEEITPDEVPTYDPEVIPPSPDPFGESLHEGPFGKIRGFSMNLRCCGCSGTSILLFIIAVFLIVYFWR